MKNFLRNFLEVIFKQTNQVASNIVYSGLGLWNFEPG
jgi:hypothetical protein